MVCIGSWAPTAVRFLGSELLYLDAGDYDGDGHSEVIFKKSGYNQDGYVLLSADFGHAVELLWSYHDLAVRPSFNP